MTTIGNAWKHPKTGEIRYYIDIDDAAEYGGLTIDRYNSGNIWHADYKGEKISNSKAYKMLGPIYKVYYTIENGTPAVTIQISQYAHNDYPEFCEDIRAGIEKALAEVTE